MIVQVAVIVRYNWHRSAPAGACLGPVARKLDHAMVRPCSITSAFAFRISPEHGLLPSRARPHRVRRDHGVPGRRRARRGRQARPVDHEDGAAAQPDARRVRLGARRASTRSTARRSSAGAVDNGGPGLRADYHPHYYSAFVLDPEGNNIEVVCHEDPSAPPPAPKPAAVRASAKRAARKPAKKRRRASKAASKKPHAKAKARPSQGKAKTKAKRREVGRQGPEEAPLGASPPARASLVRPAAWPARRRSSSAARPRGSDPSPSVTNTQPAPLAIVSDSARARVRPRARCSRSGRSAGASWPASSRAARSRSGTRSSCARTAPSGRRRRCTSGSTASRPPGRRCGSRARTASESRWYIASIVVQSASIGPSAR